jgi:hypothetical protein
LVIAKTSAAGARDIFVAPSRRVTEEQTGKRFTFVVSCFAPGGLPCSARSLYHPPAAVTTPKAVAPISQNSTFAPAYANGNLQFTPDFHTNNANDVARYGILVTAFWSCGNFVFFA